MGVVTGRGVTQPCDPATLLNRDCPGCGRGMHRRVGKRGPRAKCEHGHVVLDYSGMCASCTSTVRQRQQGAQPRALRQPRAVWHCTHDEGEPCDCELAS